MIYLNGQPAAPEELPNGSEAYLALDLLSGEVRSLNTVRTSDKGSVMDIDPGHSVIFVDRVGATSRMLSVAKDARVFLDWDKVGLKDLTSGLTVKVALDDRETVTYLQSERWDPA